jgi:hypothetical protein
VNQNKARGLVLRLKILRLIGRGLNNREIAERLGITTRCCEMNISKALATSHWPATITNEEVAELRVRELEQIQRWCAKLDEQMARLEIRARKCRTITGQVAISNALANMARTRAVLGERPAKLNGLDQPVKTIEERNSIEISLQRSAEQKVTLSFDASPLYAADFREHIEGLEIFEGDGNAQIAAPLELPP